MHRRNVEWRDEKSDAVVDANLIVHAVTRDSDWDTLTMCGRYFSFEAKFNKFHLTWAPVTCLTCIAEET